MLYQFRLRSYEWFEKRPRLYRAPLYAALVVPGSLAASWWLDDPITPGTVFGWWIFWPLAMSFIAPHKKPEPPRKKPPYMRSEEYWGQKLRRWLLAVPIAFVLAALLDSVLSDGEGLFSKPQLTFFVLSIWPTAALLPFWQPNREPRPKREGLPPLQPALQLPPRPDRSA